MKACEPTAIIASFTTRFGSYDKLAAAYDAIHSWRTASGRAFAGCSWEIYGDWTEDTTKLETHIVYLLKRRPFSSALASTRSGILKPSVYQS